MVNGYVGDSPGSFIRSFRELGPPWDPTIRDIGQNRAIIAQEESAALEEEARLEEFYDLLPPQLQRAVDYNQLEIYINPETGGYDLQQPIGGAGEWATPGIKEDIWAGPQEDPDLQAVIDQYALGLSDEMRLRLEQGVVAIRLDQYGLPYLDQGPIAPSDLEEDPDYRAVIDQYVLGLPDEIRGYIEQGVATVRLDQYGQPFLDRGPIAEGGVDFPAVVDQFTANLPAQMRGYIEAGIVTVRVDNNGLPYLAKGPLAGLLPDRALDALLGVAPAPPPSMTPYQAAQTALQQAQIAGYLGDTPTLARETMQQQNALELAGLLGYFPGLDGGDPTATLARQLGFGGLGIQQQDVDLRRMLGLGGLGIQQQGLDLQRMLGVGGLGIQQQEVDVRRMLGLGGLDIERQQLGLNRGELMGFYGGAPTLEAAQTLGSLWGQPTLQAELGRRELAIAEAAQQTEWLRNPSNFIAAQLLRGGPGATVGGVTIPGRVAETIYGGALPNPSQVGYGMFGPGQVAVPSLQTINQLNPDELQAVASAVPYLTGGAVTPNQFFGDVAYQGLRGY